MVSQTQQPQPRQRQTRVVATHIESTNIVEAVITDTHRTELSQRISRSEMRANVPDTDIDRTVVEGTDVVQTVVGDAEPPEQGNRISRSEVRTDIADPEVQRAVVEEPDIALTNIAIAIIRPLRRRGRDQLGSSGGRSAVVSHHRGHVLCPHLLIDSLGGRDRRRVLPEQVRQHQGHKVGTVDRYQLRVHGGCHRRFKRTHHRFGLCRCTRRVGCSGVQPPRIRRCRGKHRFGRRPLPGLGG